MSNKYSVCFNGWGGTEKPGGAGTAAGPELSQDGWILRKPLRGSGKNGIFGVRNFRKEEHK